MEYKDLFFKFLKASTESEVHEVLESHNLLNNPENWLPYGESEFFLWCCGKSTISPSSSISRKSYQWY